MTTSINVFVCVRVCARHPECLELLLNSEIIAVNQDPAAYPARLVQYATNATQRQQQQPQQKSTIIIHKPNDHDITVNSTQITQQVWARQLQSSGSETKIAVVLFNREESATTMTVAFQDLGLSSSDSATVRDVLRRKDQPSQTGHYTAEVAAHGVVFVVLTQTK